MGIRKYKPTSPGRRAQSGYTFEEVTSDKPHAPLTRPMRRSGGRNSQGSVSVWQKGGGAKRLYRMVDFKRDKTGMAAKVETIEYDPNRSARIALLKYKDGERRYIIAPLGVKVGDVLYSGAGSEIKTGNALPLSDMPLGTFVHNIELRPGGGAKLARSAGATVQLVARDKGYAQLKLNSGEVRVVPEGCLATVGQVGNIEYENISYGKAGRVRHLGIRPHVRGVVMNPVDHPLGGGEGRSSGGRPACSPWGKPEGVRTRSNRRTDRYIVKRRK